jgi:hypothetical protein
MDISTQLALRAIVRGLLHSDAVETTRVQNVVAALKDAAAAAQDRREADVCKDLVALAKGIRADAEA